MKLVDEAGALTCMRHAQRRVVTVAIDSMVFRRPVKIGDLVLLTEEVTYAGRTSLEAEVLVHTENPISGERLETNTAYLVYVALDDDGRPVAVPPILADTEEEHAIERGHDQTWRPPTGARSRSNFSLQLWLPPVLSWRRAVGDPRGCPLDRLTCRILAACAGLWRLALARA
jgi:acyl-CoA hydrolase